MIVAASLRALVRRRARTTLALSGIAISAALLLDMTMLASGLASSFGVLLEARGFSIRVTPRGMLPFDSEATIADATGVSRRLAAVAGVTSVAPLLGASFLPVRDDAMVEAVLVSGIDPRAQMLYTLTAGRAPGAGEVVVSPPLARDERLAVGSRIALSPEADALGGARNVRTFRVSGVAEFAFDAPGQRSAAMLLGEVQHLTDRRDQVSLYALSTDPGVSADSVARRVAAAVPEVSAYSTAELLAETRQRLAYFRQLAGILGTVALVVTTLLVATIVTIGIRERYGELATLRAIGVAPRRILLGVVTEGLALAAAGCALGLPLGLWMGERLDGILRALPGLPAGVSFFEFSPERVGAAFALVVASGAVTAAIPGWRALRAPLAAVLREEAE